ncbi:12970_t:CDS:2 [Ambispora gerdemannii]|uniref:12970_t:CDS:1 n=1 Tax=Ambispora gerdemannii TaxID=144530 RepID=A0A9N9DAM0_9GLOM|nr:12970_t:CDS:2 [Ambispora gerdemannii]
MNTSILFGEAGIRDKLPEVHAEYIFRNSPDGYNYTRGKYDPHVYYNTTNGTYHANGALILLIEEFMRGGFYTIGMHFMNRLWTIRVPETTSIPYDPDNPERVEIVSVPIAVKAYTCEMERVKDDYGSYNKWNLAVTSIYELTPEHWASYLAVKDTQTAQVEEVLVRINMPKHKIPSSVLEWARFTCKESKVNNDDTVHDLFGYKLGVTLDRIPETKLVKNRVGSIVAVEIQNPKN